MFPIMASNTLNKVVTYGYESDDPDLTDDNGTASDISSQNDPAERSVKRNLSHGLSQNVRLEIIHPFGEFIARVGSQGGKYKIVHLRVKFSILQEASLVLRNRILMNLTTKFNEPGTMRIIDLHLADSEAFRLLCIFLHDGPSGKIHERRGFSPDLLLRMANMAMELRCFERLRGSSEIWFKALDGAERASSDSNFSMLAAACLFGAPGRFTILSARLVKTYNESFFKFTRPGNAYGTSVVMRLHLARKLKEEEEEEEGGERRINSDINTSPVSIISFTVTPFYGFSWVYSDFESN